MANSLKFLQNLFSTTSSVATNGASAVSAAALQFAFDDVFGQQPFALTPFGALSPAANAAAVSAATPTIVINGSPFGFSNLSSAAPSVIFNAHGAFNTIRALGGNDIINAGGQGFSFVDAGSGNCVVNIGGISNTVVGGDGNDSVSGAYGYSSVTLGNGNDYVSLAGPRNKITLGDGKDSVGYSGAYNQITVGSGNDIIAAGANAGWATLVVGAGTDEITLGGSHNHVTLNKTSATLVNVAGMDQINAIGGADTLKLNGYGNRVSLAGDIAATIADQGQHLEVDVLSSTTKATMTGVTSDASWLVDLKNGVGGYSSVSQIMSSLQSDGNGGTVLCLGSSGYIDFANTASSQIHASNFRVG